MGTVRRTSFSELFGVTRFSSTQWNRAPEPIHKFQSPPGPLQWLCWVMLVLIAVTYLVKRPPLLKDWHEVHIYFRIFWTGTLWKKSQSLLTWIESLQIKRLLSYCFSAETRNSSKEPFYATGDGTNLSLQEKAALSWARCKRNSRAVAVGDQQGRS